MKNFKRVFSFLLAMVLTLAMTATVFADTATYTITAPEGSTHTYEVYQIFTGDLSEGVLSNVKWGKNGTGVEGEAVDQTILDELTAVNSSTDTEKLEVIEKYAALTSADAYGKLDENTTSLSDVPAGYYLIKDEDGSVTGNDSYTLYIVKVVGDVTITPKSDVPTLEKKVKDADDTNGTTSGWQDSADHDVNDVISFQLTATLPDNVSSYDTYKTVFHDTLSSGLTYTAGSVAVTIDGADKTADFTVSETNGNLTVSCADVKALGATDNSVIIVTYTATLNENAVVGSAGNPNKAYLEYSNNPNNSGEGNTETGETPEDTVIIFTYKVVINKTDGTDPLAGAAFKLEKKASDGTWTTVKEFTAGTDTTFTFSGLDDGTYRLTETATPDGYNSIDPIEFTVTADHTIESDSPALNSLSGTAASGEITFTSSTSDASLSADVVNQAGSTLPSTGGIGTTIFYVVGGILVVAAGVLLIARRRARRA